MEHNDVVGLVLAQFVCAALPIALKAWNVDNEKVWSGRQRFNEDIVKETFTLADLMMEKFCGTMARVEEETLWTATVKRDD